MTNIFHCFLFFSGEFREHILVGKKEGKKVGAKKVGQKDGSKRPKNDKKERSSKKLTDDTSIEPKHNKHTMDDGYDQLKPRRSKRRRCKEQISYVEDTDSAEDSQPLASLVLNRKCTGLLQDYKGPLVESQVRKLASQIQGAQDHEKMVICQSLMDSLTPITVRKDLNLTEVGNVDTKSMALLSDCDLPGSPKYAVSIVGDGNCLPRCGSLLAYGSEIFHKDIRLRVAIELIVHKELYLSEGHLRQGWDDRLRPLPTPRIYAMFSDYYKGGPLSNADIEAIYDREVSSSLCLNTFMGIWQLFAISSVLKVPIYSVYPNKGNV